MFVAQYIERNISLGSGHLSGTIEIEGNRMKYINDKILCAEIEESPA